MFRNSNTIKVISMFLALCSLAVFALAGSNASAAQTCKKVSGKFTLQPAITGPECTSPVGLCVAGNYGGDLAGPSVFTGSSLIPTIDTPTTGAVLVTGDKQIQTKGGILSTKDAIVLRTTPGTGNFAEVDTITGGTGEWAGAFGTIQAVGKFTSGDGGGGEYTSEVCLP